jgi:hypothetical protein
VQSDSMMPSSTMAKAEKAKTLMVTSEKRMIAPGARDAPRFKSSKPSELRRFIRSMEDLWRDANVTDDDQKKLMIGKYADQDSEEEWSAFKTFEDKYTWEEFKEELIENYPEAAAAERGTPARIRQLCRDTTKVRLGDLPALYIFRRAFMAEAKKLQKAPAAMANRELVELFISCLSDPLAAAVLQFLGSNTLTAKVASSTEIRRPEDKYDLEEVCKAALRVSENSQGMFNLMNQELSEERRGVLLYSQPASESKALSEKVNELEGEQALEKDRVVSMGKTIESRMGGLEAMLKTLLTQSQTNGTQEICKGDCKSGSCKTHEANSNPTQRWGGKSLEHEKCFWCNRMGHFQADCEDLKNQIRVGNVKVNAEGRLRLRDGSFIPNQPVGASLKEKVERHYARKPSQFYHGEYEDSDPVSPNFFSQYLGASNDAEKSLAHLKAELELRKREEALELRKMLLEQDEKKLEKSSGLSRATNVQEGLGQLSDEEVSAIKAVRSGFC